MRGIALVAALMMTGCFGIMRTHSYDTTALAETQLDVRDPTVEIFPSSPLHVGDDPLLVAPSRSYTHTKIEVHALDDAHLVTLGPLLPIVPMPGMFFLACEQLAPMDNVRVFVEVESGKKLTIDPRRFALLGGARRIEPRVECVARGETFLTPGDVPLTLEKESARFWLVFEEAGEPRFEIVVDGITLDGEPVAPWRIVFERRSEWKPWYM